MDSFFLDHKYARDVLSVDDYAALVEEVASLPPEQMISVRMSDDRTYYNVVNAPDNWNAPGYVWSYVSASEWLNT